MKVHLTSLWLGRLSEALRDLPRWATVLIGAALVSALAAIDYVTGHETSFSIFYMLSVLYVTWYAGLRWGIIVALVCAATWGVVNAIAGAHFASGWIPVWNSAVRLGFFAIGAYLLGSLHRAHQKLSSLAYSDSLTGTANTRAFYMALEREILRQRRYGAHFALCYVDLDNFKKVNDTCGHAAGDDLLRSVCVAISRVLRTTDTAARLGGDEFGVLMPETGVQAAADVVARVQSAVTETIGVGACDVPDVGATVGVMVFESPPESPDAAVHAADQLMYEGKQLGRGRVLAATYPGSCLSEQVDPN